MAGGYRHSDRARRPADNTLGRAIADWTSGAKRVTRRLNLPISITRKIPWLT